jgi:fucose permease
VSDLAPASPGWVRRLRLARTPWTAVTVAFFVNGILFASWTAHIPHVKDVLRLSDGSLGIALLSAPVGSVLATLLAARLLPRLGSKRMVRITLAGYCATGPLVGLTHSFGALFATLLLWGGFQSALDVSMNTQAISVERRAGRSLMPGFHGTWSLGAFAGAAVGVIGVASGVSLSEQLLLLAVPCLIVAGWLTASMIPDSEHAADHASEQVGVTPGPAPGGARRRPPRAVWVALLVLGGISVADMICEGAAGDWAAVYLRTGVHDLPAIAALGYASYALAMVVIRLAGNRLMTRFKVHRLVPVLAATATLLMVIALVVNRTPVLLLGFAGLGAGIAVVIPACFSAAGGIPGINSGSAVALVSSLGWVRLRAAGHRPAGGRHLTTAGARAAARPDRGDCRRGRHQPRSAPPASPVKPGGRNRQINARAGPKRQRL